MSRQLLFERIIVEAMSPSPVFAGRAAPAKLRRFDSLEQEASGRRSARPVGQVAIGGDLARGDLREESPQRGLEIGDRQIETRRGHPLRANDPATQFRFPTFA